MVDVEHDRAERRGLARRARDLGLHALLEPAAVEQAGERVDAGLVLEPVDQALVARGERAHDGGDDEHGHDDVDPAVLELGARRGSESSTAPWTTPIQATISAVPQVPKKNAIHTAGHM